MTNFPTIKPDFACRICGNSEGNITHIAREMMFGLREEFEYIECSACGSIQIGTIPDDLSRFYPENYYSLSGLENWKPTPKWRRLLKNGLARKNMGQPNILGWYAARRYKHWKAPEWIVQARPGFDEPILDVGCGAGGILNELSDLGYTNLTGIDPFVSKDIAYPNGVKIFKRSIADETGKYRLIYLHHVFEHMPDIYDCLNHLKRLIEPGYPIFIAIPVAQCEAWKRYGVNWVQLDPPRHLHVLSEKAVRLMAEHAGLEVTNVVYNSDPFQFRGSEGYRRDIPLMEQHLHDICTKDEIDRFNAISANLNRQGLGDQAVFTLRAAAAPQ